MDSINASVRDPEARRARALFVVGGLFVAAAALYDRSVAESLSPFPDHLSPEFEAAITTARLRLLGVGAGVLALAWLLRHRVMSIGLGVLVATVAGLALAEIALQPQVPGRANIYVADADLGWRLVPGSRGIWGGSFVEINEKGLRGPARPYAKPAGQQRVLVLGDSVTFGMSVAYDETFPLQLEALYRGRGERIEVINGGVTGYSPWQEYAWLRAEGMRYDPDLVVIGFTLSDPSDKFQLERFGGPTDGFELMAARGGPLLLRSGLVFNLWIRAAFARVTDLARVPEEPATLQEVNLPVLIHHSEHPLVERAWVVTQESLDGLAELCAQHGASLLLAIFPYDFQIVDPTLVAPQRRLESFAHARSIPFVDLLPDFQAAVARNGVSAQSLFIDPTHLTPAGYRVAAEALQRAIAEAGLLEPPSTS